jgi:hypothetical protein
MNSIPMGTYIGTKVVGATPMSRGAYNAYRGWQMPDNEDPLDDGYLVEYLDGGKPNDDRHAGYISWSPKDVFERSYQPSGTHVERLKIEYFDLLQKREKLEAFLAKQESELTISREHFELLAVQLAIMSSYIRVLEARINISTSP